MAQKCQKEIYFIDRQSDFLQKGKKRKEKKKRNAKNRFINIKFKLR